VKYVDEREGHDRGCEFSSAYIRTNFLRAVYCSNLKKRAVISSEIIGPLHFVVWWSEFLATDPEVPDSIPGATRFSEKKWVLNGVHSSS
jgi:hypothetical protein